MGGKVKKAFKSVGRTVASPFEKVGQEAQRGIAKVGQEAQRGIAKVGQEAQRGIAKGLGMKAPDFDISPGAAAAPDAEQTADSHVLDENIGRRKRNRRNGLRIDLNTGGAAAGNGVNLPVG